MRTILVLALLVGSAAPAHARTGFSCVIDHAQTVNTCVMGSTAMGTGTFILNDDQTELAFNVTVVGLSSAEVAAHIHEGEPGTNGDIVYFFALGGNKQGVWRSTDPTPLTPQLVAQLLAGNLYVVIHTQLCGSGEVRGNIMSDPTPTRETTWGRLKQLYRGAPAAPAPGGVQPFAAIPPGAACH